MLRATTIIILTALASCLIAQSGTTTESAVQLEAIFIDGNKEKLLGNWEKAAARFEEVLRKDTRNDAAAYELARVYLALKNTDKAVEMARNATNWNPGNIWYKLLLAELYQKDNKDKDAAGIYEALLKQYPRNPEYHLKYAYHLVRSGEQEKAIGVYNEMEKITGVQEESSRLKHNLYVGLGNYRKAAQELESLIKAYPNNTSYQHLLATFYEQINEKSKANAVYQQILAKNPDDARAKIALAAESGNKSSLNYLYSLRPIFENRVTNIDIKIKEIIPFINRLADGESELGPVLLGLAESLVAVHPTDAKALALSGDVYYHSGQIDKALTAYLKTLETDKSVWLVWEQVMHIYEFRRDFEKMAAFSEQSLDYFPNQASAYLFNGRANNALKKPQQALSSLKPAVMMAGSNKNLLLQIQAELGLTYFLLKNFPQSDAAFEEALKINPSNISVLRNYIYCLASRTETLAKASNLVEELLNVAKDRFESEAAKGFVLYKMKDYENAKLWLGKALQHSGDNDPFTLEAYGNVLFQLGQLEQAVEYWQAALQKGGRSSVLERKISERKLLE